MKLLPYVVAVPLLMFSFTCNAVSEKEQLEQQVNEYKKLGLLANKCNESGKTSSAACRTFIGMFNEGEIAEVLDSFSKNLGTHISIDQDLAFEGLDAFTDIIDTLNFLFDEELKNTTRL
ncbi:MAG: hypothetical protein AAF364_11095 [Pseudomonadota bacterium]